MQEDLYKLFTFGIKHYLQGSDCSPVNFLAVNCYSFRAAEFRVLNVRRHYLGES